MSTLLYVDKMISKKRKANELENEYVSDPFKSQVVSKWLSMCPELKDHQDATIRLCKENNDYTFTIANVGVVHITPDELYAIQDGKRVPLTTRELSGQTDSGGRTKVGGDTIHRAGPRLWAHI